jgi:hypothetical protein
MRKYLFLDEDLIPAPIMELDITVGDDYEYTRFNYV